MSAPTQPQEFWPVFPLFFVGLWMFIGFIISLSGWKWFARKYPARVRPQGKAYNAPSAGIGHLMASYRNVVRVIFTEEGVYFYVMFLFRAFHPPFLLPWESVRSVEEKKGFFRGRYYHVVVEDAVGSMKLWLPGKVERELFRYYRSAEALAPGRHGEHTEVPEGKPPMAGQ